MKHLREDGWSAIDRTQLFSFLNPRFETEKVRMLIGTRSKQVCVKKTVIQVSSFTKHTYVDTVSFQARRFYILVLDRWLYSGEERQTPSFARRMMRWMEGAKSDWFPRKPAMCRPYWPDRTHRMKRREIYISSFSESDGRSL